MFIGVTLAKTAYLISHVLIFEIIIDMIGYGLHAIGFIPFIKRYES